MSILGREVSIKPAIVLAVCMILGSLAPTMSKTPSREITLVARGMSFYLENDAEKPNPTIVLRAGETVRVVLRNQDPGMTHDFAVPALRGAIMEGLDWNETGELTLRVPDQPGTYEYACRPHRLMMRGTLRVVPN